MNKQNKLAIISDIINRVESVEYENGSLPHYIDEAKSFVRNCISKASPWLHRIDQIRFHPMVFSTSTPDSTFRDRWLDGKDEFIGVLHSIKNEIELYDNSSDNRSIPTKPSGTVAHVSTLSMPTNTNEKLSPSSSRVFIVHGHNDGIKEAVARFILQLGLEPIILHEQANKGMTIIEKFETYSDVEFAIVLLTPDDLGKKIGDSELNQRARQNVIAELGYFVGKLGRSRVCPLFIDGVEIPSDFNGVMYILYDNVGGWKVSLARELRNAGFDIDFNKL